MHTDKARTQEFSLGGWGEGGADTEAIYNLCLILKTVLYIPGINITFVP